MCACRDVDTRVARALSWTPRSFCAASMLPPALPCPRHRRRPCSWPGARPTSRSTPASLRPGTRCAVQGGQPVHGPCGFAATGLPPRCKVQALFSAQGRCLCRQAAPAPGCAATRNQPCLPCFARARASRWWPTRCPGAGSTAACAPGGCQTGLLARGCHRSGPARSVRPKLGHRRS